MSHSQNDECLGELSIRVSVTSKSVLQCYTYSRLESLEGGVEDPSSDFFYERTY